MASSRRARARPGPVLLAFVVLAAAGGARAQLVPADTTAVEWVRPEDVPARADALLRRLEGRPDVAISSLEAIERALPSLDADLAAVTRRASDAIEASVAPAELEDVRRELTGLAAPLAGWKDQLASEAKRVAEILDEVAQGRRLWSETRGRSETVAAGDVVVRRVESVLKGLDGAETRLRAWRDRVVAASDRVIERTATVDAATEALGTAIARERAGLFVPDRGPLWSRGLGSEIRRELPRVPEEIRAYAESTGAYIARDPRPLVVHVLVAVLLMLALGRLSSRALKRVAADATGWRATRLLQRPYAIALLLALLASPVFHPMAPRRFTQLAALLALFPAARIVMHTLERGNLIAFAGLFVLLLLDRVGGALQPLPALERMTFIVAVAIGFALALWLSRRVRGAGLARWLGRAANAAMLVLAIALLAEVGGWTNFATLIGRAVLAGAIAGLYVYAATLGLTALVAYAVVSPTMQRSRLFARNAAHLQRRAEDLLRWLGVVVWLYLVATALGLRGVVADVIARVLGAGISVGALSLSVGGVLAFVVTLVAAVLLARGATAVLEEDVYPRTHLPRGVPYALSTILRYVVYSLGLLFAIAAAGVRLDQMALMVGGLGIGIGLGLQDLVKNFAAGLTLLFERRMHVGDVVELPSQGIFGRVAAIGIRASVVRTWGGAEVVVPNADLISSAITNWTLSDRLCRIEVPVGVAYGTDPARVIEILLAAAAEVEPLLREPPPDALFKAFGESSLDFVVRAWTDRGWDQAAPLVSRLAIVVHDRLREAGIAIPYPQREVHLESVSPAARAALSDRE